MDTIIITALLVVFFAIMIGIGIYCRKHSTDVGGFVLGGRSIGPWLTAFAFGTSYFSAVIFVGYAGQFGWNFGLASTWIGLGNAFIGSLLAWVVLGRRTRIMTQHIGSRTMPDFFGNRFGRCACADPCLGSRSQIIRTPCKVGQRYRASICRLRCTRDSACPRIPNNARIGHEQCSSTITCSYNTVNVSLFHIGF